MVTIKGDQKGRSQASEEKTKTKKEWNEGAKKFGLRVGGETGDEEKWLRLAEKEGNHQVRRR